MSKLTNSRPNQIFSTRDVADLLGTDEWRIRRLYEDGLLEEPIRFAGKRVVWGDQIPRIVDALRSRGWLASAAGGESGAEGSEQHTDRQPVEDQ